MLKRVPIDRLRPGMFIHDLECDWLSHPFMRNRFALKDDEQIARIAAAGIHEVYIDTSQGLDALEAQTAEQVTQEFDQAIRRISASETPVKPRKHTFAEESGRAKKVRAEAAHAVRDLMQGARLGRQVSIEAAGSVVESISDSIFRNPGALISMCQIKNKDDYTFLHSVSVCALMITFARALGLDAQAIREAGMGGLVHDLGKALSPDAILNKPGRLTPEEFDVMKRHPADGHRILLDAPGTIAPALTVVIQHHERMDGTGYPNGLKGDQIARIGQMAAIADVYDAITSHRVYNKPMPPTEALRKIFEWSRFHFNPDLVHVFIRCVGIYPVGSLVRLESGKLAVVLDQSGSNSLQPVVRVIYDERHGHYVPPSDVDLARAPGNSDRIIGHEDPAKRGIDTQRFL